MNIQEEIKSLNERIQRLNANDDIGSKILAGCAYERRRKLFKEYELLKSQVTLKPVPEDIKRDPKKFYGPPFIPSVRGHIWESATKEEYVEALKYYEIAEANCNTCKHLKRIKHEKCKSGNLQGICGKTNEHLVFHPDDPLHKDCYETRRK